VGRPSSSSERPLLAVTSTDQKVRLHAEVRFVGMDLMGIMPGAFEPIIATVGGVAALLSGRALFAALAGQSAGFRAQSWQDYPEGT
jgi:hypothetical protein